MSIKNYNFLAIKELQQYAEFSMRNDDLSTLVWLEDESVVPRPTDEEILAKAEEIKIKADENYYKNKRAAEYPDFKDYLDGIVKNDQKQIQAYIDACLAVKAKYPKEVSA